MKILIVEPSRATRILMKNALGAEGPLEWVETLAQARAALRGAAYDAVVAALKLADGDAMDLVTEVRGALILVADEPDGPACVRALEGGADDFIAAPLDPRELRARVVARARHKGSASIVSGDLELDLAARTVRFGGQDLELTGREFGILSHLVRHEGQVVARDALIAAVWGPAVHVMDRTISTHIYTLRKKLGPVAAGFIRAELGAGYRFSRPPAPAEAARSV